MLLACLCQLTSSLDFRYHNHTELTTYLHTVSTQYPDLTYLYNIGNSIQGRELWVLAIGQKPRSHVTLRPHVKYVGNMHGNEVIGREMLLHLIDYYLTNYGVNSTITSFLNNTVVHIMPTMNPDGFAISAEGDCNGVYGRGNAHGFDLNRNFPGYFEVNTAPIQQETQAIMDWLKTYRFILSANLHGGAVVANYPFDNYENGSIIQEERYVRSPDDDTFQHLSKVYSYSHGYMYTGQHCGDKFPEGITNGAWWYPVLGGMQDYNYVREGCMEITLEIGCCKYPNASDLPYYWTQNKDALVNFLKEVHIGVKGLVLNPNGTIVPSALMRIKGRESMTFKSSVYGEYWRLLMPGSHIIQVLDSGNIVAEKQVTISGLNVVRVDIHIGDAGVFGDARLIRSYFPFIIGLVCLSLYIVS